MHEDRLRVSDLPELGVQQAELFQTQVSAALAAGPGIIDIDLSGTITVDCSGLGALVAVYDLAQQRNADATLRLLDPLPPVQQLLELTRLHHLFRITHRTAAACPS